MKTAAIIGFCWLIGQFLFLIAWAFICEWREPSRGKKCEIWGKEIG